MPVRAKRAYDEDYIAFRWQDVGPSEIRLHQPLGRVEVKSNSQWVLLSVRGEPIHDDGYDLEVRYLGHVDKGLGQYELRWYNPVPGGEYRFRIEPRGEHAALISQAFFYRGFVGGPDAEPLVSAGAE